MSAAPLDCLDLDLSAPAAPGPAVAARALVRLHGHPLGVVHLTADERAADGGTAAALAALSDQVGEHLRLDGLDLSVLTGSTVCALDLPAFEGLVSVVVCTVGEDPRLLRTVQSLLAQTHTDLDLVVVDNRPATGGTRALLAGVDDPRLRIVDEPCKGLSAARNSGLAHARGVVVAYTDDDAHADPHWVRTLTAPFALGTRIVATTGLVVPDELDTPAQRLFEEFGGFDKGYDRVLWALHEPGLAVPHARRGERGALFPYSAGVYGSGNNMAFRTAWLRGSGLFDEALGAGSLTRGGEDLDAFLTVMLRGGALVYEPAAIVRHSARADMEDLRTQLYGYGSGNSAAMTRQLLAGPGSALAVLARVPAGLRRLLDPGSSKNAERTTSYPKDLSRIELRGFAAGPLLYVRSRREARRRRRADPLATG